MWFGPAVLSSQAPALFFWSSFHLASLHNIGGVLGLPLLVVAKRAVVALDLVSHKYHPEEIDNLHPGISNQSPGVDSGETGLGHMSIMEWDSRVAWSSWKP